MGRVLVFISELDRKTAPLHIVDERQHILRPRANILLRHSQISVRRNGSVTERSAGPALLDCVTRIA
jgi:hypothetical protein